MPQINIPDALFHEVERVLPKTVSPDDFVVMAVQEKLSMEDRKREFFRLSDLAREAMNQQNLSELDVLADFESTRQSTPG